MNESSHLPKAYSPKEYLFIGVVGLVLVFMITGCNSGGQKFSGVAITANTDFTLKVGEKGVFEPNGLMVEFVGVKADSRCPADAQCIRAGDATVQVKTTGLSTNASLELTAPSFDRKDQASLGDDGGIEYSLQFLDLKPYPRAGQPILAEDYQGSFKLIVK